MTRIFDAFIQKMDVILKWAAVVLIGTMTLIICIEVLSRYIFQTSIPWANELARFLFIWVTFIGAVIAGRNNEHIGIEIFQNVFGKKFKKGIKSISQTITSFFFGLLAILGISVFDTLMSQTSPAMKLPIGIPYLGIIIGSILLCLLYALKNIKGVNYQ
ncbi:TRAP transporter small permease [Virgibacillus oceani]